MATEFELSTLALSMSTASGLSFMMKAVALTLMPPHRRMSATSCRRNSIRFGQDEGAMQTFNAGQSPEESPQPKSPGNRAGFRQRIGYGFPGILMVVGAGFGSAAIYYRTQELALQKRMAEAQSLAQETREKVERESKLHPEEPGLAIANMFFKFGTSAEEQKLATEQLNVGQKYARALGVALATGFNGLIWLLLMSFSNRSRRWPAVSTVTLASLSFMVISASYALILRHRASHYILTSYFSLAGGLLPLVLLQPATVWVGGVKPTKALVLFLIPAAADLIGLALLYCQVRDPMGILLGLSLTYNELNQDWYLGVALAQWGASLVAFYLAWLFRVQSVRSIGPATDGQFL